MLTIIVLEAKLDIVHGIFVAVLLNVSSSFAQPYLRKLGWCNKPIDIIIDDWLLRIDKSIYGRQMIIIRRLTLFYF